MSTARPVVLGLSCGILPPSPTSALFKGKPLHYCEGTLSAALARAGALPILLPALAEPAQLAALLDLVDGLVLSGGTDVSPQVYGEAALEPAWAGDPARDAYERALIDAALARRRPILGVCRGAQILNASLGGALYQDIRAQLPGALTHRDWDRYERNGHRVTIAADSWLAATLGAGEHAVNSVHHQAIRRVAPSLRCVAVAPDSVVEAVERIDAEQFLVGVQWHPEWQTADDPDDPGAASRGHALFAAFVAAVGARRSP
jgi:putative glutamine amidotransferase